MKRYQFSQNRLVAKFEEPDFQAEPMESGKPDFSGASGIDRPSKKESLETVGRGFRKLSEKMKEYEFLKVYAAQIDGIKEKLGTNAIVGAVQKEVAKVVRNAKDGFFKWYKGELIKKNPALEWPINAGYDAAIAGVDAKLNGLIDALANAEAAESYDATVALAEGLADLAENMQALVGIMNIPMIDIPDPRIMH